MMMAFCVLSLLPLTADTITLWPVLKTGKTDLSKIVGAYQYTMDGNALCSVSVVVASSSSGGRICSLRTLALGRDTLVPDFGLPKIVCSVQLSRCVHN